MDALTVLRKPRWILLFIAWRYTASKDRGHGVYDSVTQCQSDKDSSDPEAGVKEHLP